MKKHEDIVNRIIAEDSSKNLNLDFSATAKIVPVYTDKWMEMRIITDDDNDVHGYSYSHEKSCDGKKIVILPFRRENNGTEYLLRREVTPCWGLKPVVSSITGGYEGGDLIDTVVKELQEEAGYLVDKNDIIHLDSMFGIKSSDTIYFIYTVDLTGKQKGEATGDGSELEKKAYCYWTKDISQAKDPFVYAAFVKLQNR